MVSEARKTNLFLPIFIISPSVNSRTVFMDDFFWHCFPYTQAKATHVFRIRKELPEEVNI